MTSVKINFCNSEKVRQEKIRGFFICSVLPILFFLILFSIHNFSSVIVLLFLILICLLNSLKLLLKKEFIEIFPNGIIFLQIGASRKFKKAPNDDVNTFEYASSMKRGSDFYLKFDQENVISFSIATNKEVKLDEQRIFLESPDLSPFNRDGIKLVVKLKFLNTKNLGFPLLYFIKKNEIKNVTIYFSVESVSEFYKALPKNLKQKCEGEIINLVSK